MSDIKDYELHMGPDLTIPGKVFIGQALAATGSELSFQSLVPGQDSGFLHTHKSHEELYFILKGEGEYQVDGEIFPVSEGSIVRVAPAGKRAIKNTGTAEMLMLCIQYKADSFGENDSPAGDGVILNEPLAWESPRGSSPSGIHLIIYRGQKRPTQLPGPVIFSSFHAPTCSQSCVSPR